MNSISKSLADLSESIDGFIEEYKHHYSTDSMSELWSVKDVLCHITYWHRYYAENLAAEARGGSHIMPKTKLYLMNQKGVEEMRPYSDKKLFILLTRAHKKLAKAVLSGKVIQMTYWEGRKPYSLLTFLEIVDRHIGSHTRGIRKKRKIKNLA
jgi:uncharacterized damage-inducible protein DinB